MRLGDHLRSDLVLIGLAGANVTEVIHVLSEHIGEHVAGVGQEEVPPHRERVHIKLLARICRFVRHPGFMDELKDAADEAELVRAFERMDGRYA